MNNKPSKKGIPGIESAIFFPSLVIVVLFCIWVFRDPDKAQASMVGAFAFITDTIGWVYEWLLLAVLGVCLFFAFGPYGKKRLGNEKPEFSTISWLGMIFTGFAGLGVLTWGTIEYFYYMQTPPFGIEPFSNAAKPWALAYPLINWGFFVFAIYIFIGLAFAYSFFVKKRDIVRPSSACAPFLPEKMVNGWLGKVIDVFFVVGLIGGMATCLGVNVPTMSAVTGKVFNLEHSLEMDAIIILSWSVCMAGLLYLGLKKGIKLLSDIRVYFGFALLLFLLFAGPTSYILNTFTDTLGHLFSNFFKMTMTTDPHFQSRLPQDWSIFYYAWYVALALQSALFLGRISRGRTVREFILGSLIASTAGSWVFFMVFSNYSMHILNAGTVPIAEIMKSSGQGEAIVAIWQQFPLAKFLMPCLMVYGYISMQTLLNGGTYTLAMVTGKLSPKDGEPPIWVRIFWSLALGAIAIALVYMGGIKVSQSITIIASVPTLIIIVLIVAAFFKDIKNTWGKEIREASEARERLESRQSAPEEQKA